MLILGIDPGYAIVGYGVVNYDKGKFTTLDYGAVLTDYDMSFDERLEQIYDSITDIIKKYNIDAVAIEELFFSTNQKTAIKVANARGVLILAARKHRIPIYEYTPIQIKSAIVGYGRAVKSQVMEMTRIILGLNAIPKPDDTADALAVAICHGHTSASALFNIK